MSWIRTVWINLIVWNRNVFWQLNCVLMLNWIVFNRTDYLHKDGSGVKKPHKGWYAIKPKQTTSHLIS